MSKEDKQYSVVTSADMDKIGAPVEPTPEEKAAAEKSEADAKVKAEEDAKIEAEAELLTDDEKKLEPEEQEKVKKTRISKQKRELMAKEEELARIKRERDELEDRVKKLTPAPKQRKEPELKDFKTEEEWGEAVRQYWVEEGQIQARAQAEQQRVFDTFKSRQSEFMTKQPDYADTLKTTTAEINDTIKEAVFESEIGPEILYYIAKNPDEAKKLNGKYGLKELGSIERMLKAEAKAEKKDEKREDFKSTPDLKIVDSGKKPVEPINPIRGNGNDLSPSGLFTADGKFTGSYQDFKRLSKEGKIK